MHYRELNRPITLLKMTEAVDARSGEMIPAIASAHNVWASIADTRTAEGAGVSAQDSSARCVFTIRYREDVTHTWRVLDQKSRTWLIEGEPEEVGRRQYLKLYCAQVT